MDTYILIFILSIISMLSIFLYRSKKLNDQLISELKLQMDEYSIDDEFWSEKTKIESDLEARTALLVDVSHEIRSRLHGIVSLSEVLSTRWDNIQDSDRKKHSTTIFEASLGLINFMNDLLDFSKFNAGKMVFNFSELNLAESVDEVINYCKKIYLLDEKIILNLQNKKVITQAHVIGDKARINQLIMNLFINAIKYADRGNIIVNLGLINHKGISYWKFSLQDEGVGIAKDELENIFEPFTQGSQNKLNKKVGSGLGLAMCKQIIEAHSGEIWAENNHEKGAKFSFIIPALETNSN